MLSAIGGRSSFKTLVSGFIGRRFGDKRIVLLGLTLMLIGGAIAGAADSYAPVRPDEGGLGPGADSGLDIGRDVVGVDDAKRRLQPQPAGIGFAARARVADGAIADRRQALTALDQLGDERCARRWFGGLDLAVPVRPIRCTIPRR